MSCSGVCWTICKSASRSRQTTAPAPHHSGFYRPDALPAAHLTASKHWRQFQMTVTAMLNFTESSHLKMIPSVLWRCWLGSRKGIRPVKNFCGGVLAWLSVWSEVQTCMWPRWYHCHSLSLASVKSRLVFTFLVLADPGSPGKRAIKRVCVCVCVVILRCCCGLQGNVHLLAKFHGDRSNLLKYGYLSDFTMSAVHYLDY